MKTIGASKFKESCLQLLDQVDAEGILITKHGKPVAKLISIEQESIQLLGALKDKLVIQGDIMNTGLIWNAKS